MRKQIFRKLHSPELSEQLAKYAQPDKKTLIRSEQKLQQHKMHGDTEYEAEVYGVAEYRRSRLAPVVSLAACAVIVAGIGGIYAIKVNKPAEDITPGSSAETLATQPEHAESHYMHHALSSAYAFDMFDLLFEPDLLFVTENSAPEYFTIPQQQRALLAEYIANAEAWEIMPENLTEDLMLGGNQIYMYISYLDTESVVTFWSDGYITEQTSGSGIVQWWKTKPEMYASIQKLTEKPQDSFALPYQTFEAIRQNPDAVLDAIFGEKGAPFGDITNESVRGMCAAYAPYVSEIPEGEQNAIAEAVNHAVWREVDPNTPEEDGESYALYVWNLGEPYVLHFYSNKLVLWDDGKERRKFRTSEEISGLVYDALNYPDVLEHLTWVEPSDNMREDVWTAVNAAAAEVDLSAYEVVMDEFNHKHRVHWKIVTPEDYAPTQEGYEVRTPETYADVIAEILKMTPEEYAEYLEETYEQNALGYPEMPYLEGEFTVSYRNSDGTETVLEDIPEAQLSELISLINESYWTSTEAQFIESGVVNELPPRDEGEAYINAFIFRNGDKTLTICQEEHIAVWFVDQISDNIWSNCYFELWDELESLLNKIER